MEREETSRGLEGLEFEGSAATAAVMNTTDVGSNMTNITYYPYYQHSLYVAASFVLAYFLIFLLCMVGNILVCFIVVENRRMWTVINLFILNLAISDLLVGIFCIPTTLVDNLITGNESTSLQQGRASFYNTVSWNLLLFIWTNQKCHHQKRIQEKQQQIFLLNPSSKIS